MFSFSEPSESDIARREAANKTTSRIAAKESQEGNDTEQEEADEDSISKKFSIRSQASPLHVIHITDHDHTTYQSLLEHLYTGEPIYYSPLDSLSGLGDTGLGHERPSPKDVYRLAQSAFAVLTLTQS